jgi:2-polyprenyl-3-methyl-5-hydroxy-6-metoxy-1,4-benzoquinol methylase
VTPVTPLSPVAVAGRHGVVAAVLAEHVARARAVEPDRSPTVLDCGGGTGAFAVPLAAAGASVMVLDTSADALATLARRAEEAGVAESIIACQGEVEAIGAVIGQAMFDLVLAHGVLETVDDADAAFAAIAAAVRPGGLLSVLVGNPVSAVLARAAAGEMSAALDEVHRMDRADARLGPDRIRQLCAQYGLAVEQVRGVGVFLDWIPGAALEGPGAGAELARLETETATRAPFADIAARVHLLARRSAG